MSGSESVAADLRARILSGELPVGRALPPERELADEQGVSRTTVRAALTLLEAEGLVVRRVGRGGGTFASDPGARAVTSALQRTVGMSGFPAVDLAEARAEIEPRCAAFAAARITAGQLADLRDLQTIMARTRDRSEFFAANARFHVLIAEVSGNAVLAAIISGLVVPIRDVTDDPLRIRRQEMAETVRVHELLLAALSDGDAEAAESVMRAHLTAHAEVVGGAPGD